MHMTIRTRKWLAAVAASLMLLSACQESDTQTPPTPPTVTRPAPETTTPPPETALPTDTTDTSGTQSDAPDIPPPPTPPTEWILTDDAVDAGGMNVVWQNELTQFPDDEHAKLTLYVAAEVDEEGNLAFDDGQDWLLVLETAIGRYPIFPRRYVQIGDVSCTVFNDLRLEPAVFHVMVTVRQTAGFEIYDCVYDQAEKAFRRLPVYSVGNINMLAQSSY